MIDNENEGLTVDCYEDEITFIDRVKWFIYDIKSKIDSLYVRYVKRENGYTNHFDVEVKSLKENFDEDDRYILESMIPEIKSLMLKFGDDGHSGMSAPYAISVLSETIKKSLLFETLSPLHGTDNEWYDVSNGDGGTMYQNIRNSAVFKDSENGRPYYLNGIIWSGEDEYDTFSGSVQGISSSVFIVFPCTPKMFYIDVKKVSGKSLVDGSYCEDNDGKEYHYQIKDLNDLEQVKDYYGSLCIKFTERGEVE